MNRYDLEGRKSLIGVQYSTFKKANEKDKKITKNIGHLEESVNF